MIPVDIIEKCVLLQLGGDWKSQMHLYKEKGIRSLFLSITSNFSQLSLLSVGILSTAKNMCAAGKPSFSIRQRLSILSLVKYKLTQQP